MVWCKNIVVANPFTALYFRSSPNSENHLLFTQLHRAIVDMPLKFGVLKNTIRTASNAHFSMDSIFLKLLFWCACMICYSPVVFNSRCKLKFGRLLNEIPIQASSFYNIL